MAVAVTRAPARPFARPQAAHGFWSWISTVDHKRIGILYGVTAFLFFVVGGVEALLIRMPAGGSQLHRAVGPGVQPALHHARHHHGVPGDHAAGGGVR